MLAAKNYKFILQDVAYKSSFHIVNYENYIFYYIVPDKYQ